MKKLLLFGENYDLTILTEREYYRKKKAFINPEDLTKPNPVFPELCVSTFSENIINKFASLNNVEVIDYLYSANGSIPVYKMIYENTPIAFYLSRVGAPACVAGIEEIIALGAKKIVLFGSCGILNSSAEEKIIVPTSAIRDEGTSYHYLEAADEVCADDNSVNRLTNCLEKCGFTYVKGKTWTTDAIYRETASLIEERKEAGCLCVEMECAAALAVTQFRGIPFAQFLFGADNLDNSKWEPRDLTEYGLSNAEKYMALAFECAIHL